MNKKDFLNKLREKIKILNNDEVEDIINEYSEHIDEKVKSGVSESNIINNVHILQATLSGWGDYDLIAYLPIPIRVSAEYNHIAGTT